MICTSCYEAFCGAKRPALNYFIIDIPVSVGPRPRDAAGTETEWTWPRTEYASHWVVIRGKQAVP